MPAGAKHDLGRGVAPAEDDVVGPHAIGQVVAIERGGGREALRAAAASGHDVDLGVAVVLGGESELGAVARITWENRVAGRIGEATRGATVGGDRVELAAVGEGDGLVVGGWETQEASRVVRRSQERGGGDDDGEAGEQT